MMHLTLAIFSHFSPHFIEITFQKGKLESDWKKKKIFRFFGLYQQFSILVQFSQKYIHSEELKYSGMP